MPLLECLQGNFSISCYLLIFFSFLHSMALTWGFHSQIWQIETLLRGFLYSLFSFTIVLHNKNTQSFLAFEYSPFSTSRAMNPQDPATIFISATLASAKHKAKAKICNDNFSHKRNAYNIHQSSFLTGSV